MTNQTAKPKLIPGKRPKLGMLRNIKAFSAGVHKGQKYTRDDLASMVENFRKFSSPASTSKTKVVPPAKIGHEDDQPWLKSSEGPQRKEDTGIPSMGQVVGMRQQGDDLFVDVNRMPYKIAKLIDAGAYHKISPEVYDNPPEGVPGKGPMLRALSFLGGELPHIKDLGDLPLCDYYEDEGKAFSESFDLRCSGLYTLKNTTFRRDEANHTFLAFSEVTPMTREEMIPAAIAKGMAKETVETMDDMQLKAALEGKEGTNEPGNGTMPDTVQLGIQEEKPNMDPVDEENVSTSAMAEGDMPWSSAENSPDAMNAFKEHCQKQMDGFQNWHKEKFGEDAPVSIHDDEEADDSDMSGESGVDDEMTDEDADGSDMDETEGDGSESGNGNEAEGATDDEDLGGAQDGGNLKKDKSGGRYFSEDQITKAVQKAFQPYAKKFSESTMRRDSQDIDSFLHIMSKEGRIAPSELDGRGGVMTLRQRLAGLDDTAKVASFKESATGKFKRMTLRQAEMERIRQLPAKFHEQVKVQVGTGEFASFSEADLDVERFKSFAESHADGLAKINHTPKSIVETYQAGSKDGRAQLFAELKMSLPK